MANNMQHSARSNYGCWTCRARKKKCDETHPSCVNCTSLRLYCYGYGPRPKWMDRGELQKQQAQKLKLIASATKSKRRGLSYVAKSSQSSGLEFGPLSIGETSSTISPLSNTDHGTSTLQFSDASSESSYGRIEDRHARISNELIWSESIYKGILPAKYFFKQADSTSIYYPDPCGNTTPIESRDMESNLVPFRSSESASSSTPSKYSNFQEEFFHDDQANLSCFFQQCPFSTSEIATQSIPLLADTFGSTIYGDADDTLFMHYLDRVFYVQYPFYQHSRQERGWLFSILKRERCVYYASLALSQHHQHSVFSRNSRLAHSLENLRAENRYFDLALREIQLNIAELHKWSGTQGLIRSIGVLVCTLQFVFWELFHGGTENWQIHLRAASTLLPALVQLGIIPNTLGWINLGNKYGQQEETFAFQEDNSVLEFLIGSFISFDILSCASTRLSPFLDLDHKLILESDIICLENIIGCQNWVIILIFEISLLDQWKKEAQVAKKLSIVELANRGCQIEERIERYLANMENIPCEEANTEHRPSTETNSGRTPRISPVSEITTIFALAAITYLHVVVSGAHPELPELVESVSKTLAALQNLTDTKWLRHVVWPFCITGCLALEEQHSSFRDLVIAADITQSSVGTCLEALKIIEECWVARKNGLYNCDWAVVMKRQECYVLLR